VNGDSILDAVAAGSALVVLRGTGTGALSPAVTVASDAGLTDVAVADINGDGRPDIVVTGSTGLSVFTAQASGGYTRRDLDAGTNPSDVAIVDVDHDGAPDALLLNRNTPEARGNVNVFFNDSL
jgi:hypothetical protein